MTYTKPEIAVLGNASTVIQGNKKGSRAEGAFHTPNPAYDLDE